MKRQIIISIALFFFWGTIHAQYQHEFSVYSGGGLSTLNYKPAIGEQKHGLGGHFGLGYHFFFSPKWGLGTGAELAFYNARFNVNNLNMSYMTTDIEGVDFEFRSVLNNYKEKQRAMILQIPLMLQFQTNKPDSKRQFFAAAGAKAGIPLSGKYRTTASLNNAGYYEYENSLYDTQTFMGFGSFPNKKANGGLDFKTAFFASAEAGVKWKLRRDGWSLYTGAYLDYGLNNIKEKQNVASMPSFVEYNRATPAEFAVNSVMKSQYRPQGNIISSNSNIASPPPQAFIDKINPIAAGIKLRLSFGKNSGRSKTQPISPAAPIIEDPVKEAPIAEEDPVVEETPAVEAPIVEERIIIVWPIDNYTLSQTEVAAYQRERVEEKMAVLLEQYPTSRFYIYGHTCDLGSVEVNERIGLGRAASVRAYLIANGIAPSRILGIASKRDTEPVVPNTSEENRRKNRRVEIILE